MSTSIRARKQFIIILTLALSVIPAFAGIIVTENRQIGDFTGIEISGGYTVYLSQDSAVSLRLEGDKDDLAKIVTEVVNGKLVIKHRKSIRLFSFDHDNIKVYIGFKDITSLELNGSNDVTGQKPLRFKNLGIDVSGSGDISMDLQAARVDAELSGSGDLSLRGAVDELSIDVSGSSDINCLDLKAKKVALSISGSGDAKLDASEELSISISGSGDVTYRGNPAKVSQHVSGSGDIKKIVE